MATEPLRIEMFGGLRVCCNGTVIDRFATRNTGALLARLAFQPDRAHPREELACLLWPEADDETARHNLRQTLVYLRRAIESTIVPGSTVLVADKATVRLATTAIVTDLAQFDGLLRSARETGPARIEHLTEAVNLYRGELLAGYYEEWILPERRRQEAAYVGALDDLQRLLWEAGEPLQAADYALKVATLDPYREEAHLAVMRLFAAAGQPATVRRQYEEMERILRDDLGEEPSEATRAEAERLVVSAAGNAPRLDTSALVPWRRMGIARARSLPVALAAGAIGAAVIMPAWLWSHPRADNPPQNAAAVGKTDSADTRFQALADLREHGFQAATPVLRDAARKRHAMGCLALAEQAWKVWYGPEEARWVKRLEVNHDDLRTALQWLLEKEPGKAMQMSGALTRFWYLRGYAREGHRWLRDSLAAAKPERTVACARALVGCGFLSGDHGQVAESQCRKALSIYRERGDRWGQAHALRHLGFLASEKQRTAEPKQLYDQALRLFQDVGDERGQAVTLLCMGFLSQPDRDDKTSLAMSDDHMTRSLVLFRKVGNAWGVSMALDQLGANAASRRQIDRAETLLAEARRLDPYTAIPSVKAALDRARLAVLQGDPRAFGTCRTKALEMARDAGDKVTLAWILDWAVTGSSDWDLERRSRLRAASMAFDRSLGVRQNKFDLAIRRKEVAHLRSRLGNEQFEAAFRAGARLTWEQAVEEALPTP
jgi:DNA-binding SARP family transcriptional activator